MAAIFRSTLDLINVALGISIKRKKKRQLVNKIGYNRDFKIFKFEI